MKKGQVYKCSECHRMYSQWMGKCLECLNWNTIIEEIELNKTLNDVSNNYSQRISEIKIKENHRLIISSQEFSRVLGGGIVCNGFHLLSGSPGVGKSSFLTKYLGDLSLLGIRVLYVSAEETLEQVALRTQRIGISDSDFFVLNEPCLENIISEIKKLKPQILIIDSVQTIYTKEISSLAGSPNQIREVTLVLMELTKVSNIATFLIGHITKDGLISGPKHLEHMVDVVLFLERNMFNEQLVLRCNKNRFGPINEIGIFQMRDGIFTENLTSVFTVRTGTENIGEVNTFVKTGSRYLPLRVESLLSKNSQGQLRKIVEGFSLNRLSLIVAIIERYIQLNLNYYDIYLNLSFSCREIKELDLAVISSLLSSHNTHKLNSRRLFYGEVSLSGEVKPCPMINDILKEACRNNFTHVVTNNRFVKKGEYPIEIIGIDHISRIENCL